VTQYNLEIHTTAKRELQTLDSALRERLTETLVEVAHEREPTKHPDAKMLEGQPGLFRVRVGDARAVLELQKPNLRVLRCGRRNNVYEKIDEINDRRATG